MKIRIYPSKSEVVQLLLDKLSYAEDVTEKAQKEVDDAREAIVHQPGRLEQAQLLLNEGEELLSALHVQLSMVESHKPNEVACEIEL